MVHEDRQIQNDYEKYKADHKQLTEEFVEAFNHHLRHVWNSNLQVRVADKYNVDDLETMDVYYDVKDPMVDFQFAQLNKTDQFYSLAQELANIFFPVRGFKDIEINFNNTGSAMWFHLPLFDSKYLKEE